MKNYCRSNRDKDGHNLASVAATEEPEKEVGGFSTLCAVEHVTQPPRTSRRVGDPETVLGGAAPTTMVAHTRASSPLRLTTPLLLSVVAAVAGAAVAVVAADENICFRKRVALCLWRPSSSASISSSTRCRQASLWPLAFVPVAAAVQPGHPSNIHIIFQFLFFLTSVHTPALDSWGPRPRHTRKVSLWHCRFCRHTD